MDGGYIVNTQCYYKITDRGIVRLCGVECGYSVST